MKLNELLATLLLVHASLSVHAAILMGPVTNAANGHLYYLLSQNTWTASETEAVALGGHLVTINDAAENQWVFNTFAAYGGTNRSLWLGLYDITGTGDWRWVTGQPVTYLNWAYGGPNYIGLELWVYMYEAGTFNPATQWNNYLNNTNSAEAPLHGVVEIEPLGFLTNGLIAYYPFSGNVNDESGFGHNATLQGGQFAPDRFGHANMCLSNATTLPAAVVVNFQNPAPGMTISLWYFVRDIADIPVSGVNRILEHHWGLGSFSTGIFTNGVLGCFFSDRSIGTTNGVRFGAWQHLVFVVSGKQGRMFLDGNFVGSTLASSTLVSKIDTLGIGSLDSSYRFKGLIDDVRIYNRALPDTEVHQLYHYESPPCVPHAATATPTVVNGFVVGASLNDGGCGYTNAPTVRILGDVGSGAQAVAVVSNGIVVAVNIQNAGSGYTNSPIIVIKPPFIPQPTMSGTALNFGPLVTPVLELQLGNLSPYDNYQFQFTPVAAGVWSNYGVPFTPTAAMSTAYVSASGSFGFFRVKYLP